MIAGNLYPFKKRLDRVIFIYGFEKGGMGYGDDNINKLISYFHFSKRKK